MSQTVTNIKRALKKLSDLTSHQTQIAQYVQQECEKEEQELASIRLEQNKLGERAFELEAQKHEICAQAYAELEQTGESIKKEQERIKAYGHSMPAEELEKGLRLNEHGFRVTISRIEPVIEYDVKILVDHPELADITLEGDPLVERQVNPYIMERLIQQGDFPQKLAKKYRSTRKIKNPSVRITEQDNE